MDAVRFIEERNRMCKSFDKCSYGCPAWDGSCKLETGTNLECEADKQVEIVKEWAAAHPRTTRQSEFLKQWPNAKVDANGVLEICPVKLDTNQDCLLGQCTHMSYADCCDRFWKKVVE